MKKLKRVLLFLLILFLLPLGVKAETVTTTLSGGTTVAGGDKIDFTIGIKSDTNATAFEAAIRYDTNVLEFIGIGKEDKWQGNNEVRSTGNNTLKFTNAGVTGESSVATLKFRVKTSNKTSTTVTLDGIKVTLNTKTGEEIKQGDPINKDITIKSEDNTLKSIKIDNKTINGFATSVKEYTIEVESSTENIDIKAQLSDEKGATLVENFGSRTVKLEYGTNKVLIKVKSESGKEGVYTLNIIRKDDRPVDNNLKSIIINGGTIKIEFDPSTLSYTIKTFKLEKLEIEATPSDTTAKVDIAIPKKIIIGQNTVKITVTPTTDSKKEYTILFDNTDKPTDTRLKNLSIKGININFESDKYDYEIRYDKSYKNGIKIYDTALSEDTKITIKGNNNLEEGSVIKVLVEALDGSGSSEYRIRLVKDTRINFFLIVDIIIGIVLVVLIFIQLNKRKKKKEAKQSIEEELEKTKEIVL